MRCAACGTENAPGLARCFVCGSRLADDHDAGGAERELLARLASIADFAEAGRLAPIEAELERCRALATVLAVPLYEGRVAVAGAMLELARGRFAAGEQLALEGRRALEAAGDRDATWLYVLQMYPVRRAQEGLAELEPDLARCADHGGASLLDAALRAEAYGDRGGVAALLSSRHEGLTQPLGGDRAAALAAAIDACSPLSDRAAALAVDALMVPFDKRHLVARQCAFWGPAARPLGLLASARSERALAVRRLEDALAMARAAGAEPWAAQTARDLAGTLLAGGGREDRRRAIALLDEGLGAAVRLGMHGVAKSILGLKLEAQGASRRAAGATAITAVYDEVARERPDISSSASQDGSITIVFSDIEGSTELNERVGDRRWLAIVRRHNSLIRDRVAAHRGAVVKSRGDGFMLVFDAPGDAVACAVALQRAFDAAPDPDLSARLRVRIGIHSGRALRDEGELYGRNVNLAARIADSAAGGEILVSETVSRRVGGGRWRLDEGRELELRGVSGRQRVHTVLWVPSATADQDDAGR